MTTKPQPPSAPSVVGTPRTDAATKEFMLTPAREHPYRRLIEFAQQVERELVAATNLYADAAERAATLQAQLREAQETLREDRELSADLAKERFQAPQQLDVAIRERDEATNKAYETAASLVGELYSRGQFLPSTVSDKIRALIQPSNEKPTSRGEGDAT